MTHTATTPRYGELALILVIGLLQPIIEIPFGSQISTYYNGLAIGIVLVYVAWRIMHSKGSICTDWGIRLDNFLSCLPPHLVFAIIASFVIYGYGWYAGHTPLPIGFWYVLGLYPLWGLAQQFALQNLVARNLTALVPSIGYRSLVTATIFACAHIPSVELVILTFASGFCFTYLYYFYPNLLAIAIAHGILGALVFHLVLGQDQWAILQQYLSLN